MATEYWLISAPADKTCEQTWNTICTATKGICAAYKFNIPDLKVGTLDQLVGLADDLAKLDTFVEGVTKKVAHYLGEVLEDHRDKLHENLTANNTDLPSYVSRFTWDGAKYPTKQSLRNISDIIGKQATQIDVDLKAKSSAYNALKSTLHNLEKKQTGSLLTRNLADLVKKEHFIGDSEYLSTLLVIVPKSLFKEWETTYEKITDMIVPRSSQLVYQDADYGLYTVTLFKKVVEEFKLHARERKFIVREFHYNEKEMSAEKDEMSKLCTEKKKQFGPLVRWLKVNFSECFTAWVHVKALRVFVESVLRYGLPVSFAAALLPVEHRAARRAADALQRLLGHLDASAHSAHSAHAAQHDAMPAGFSAADYYPYVCYKFSLDVTDKP